MQESILYRLYIGANNISREVETVKIKDRVSIDYPQGFTLIPATGNWKLATGTIAEENNNIIEIMAAASDENIIINIAKDLKITLDQEAILMTSTPLQIDFI